MDATCEIQDSIHVFRLVYKYVSRILGTYQFRAFGGIFVFVFFYHNSNKRYRKRYRKGKKDGLN